MRFSVAAVLAFASAVLAVDPTPGFDVVSHPLKNEKIPAGKTYEVVWAPSTKYAGKTVSIILIGGESQDHQDVLDTIATGISSDAGKFSWSVDADLGDEAVYGLQVVLDEDKDIYQWSFPFSITASEHGGHSSASSSATTSVPVSSTSAPSSKTTGYPVESSSTLTSSIITHSAHGNSSSTVSVPATTTASSTTSSTSPVATGAAGAYAANGFAVLGGFAMAVLAL